MVLPIKLEHVPRCEPITNSFITGGLTTALRERINCSGSYLPSTNDMRVMAISVHGLIHLTTVLQIGVIQVVKQIFIRLSGICILGVDDGLTIFYSVK